MANKLMYIPNDETKNYPFCSPQSCSAIAQENALIFGD